MVGALHSFWQKAARGAGRKRLKAAKRRYRLRQRAAQRSWIASQTRHTNRNDQQACWRGAKSLISGLNSEKPTGRLEATAEEVEKHFREKVFGIDRPETDIAALEGLRQRQMRPELDATPSVAEVDASIASARAGKATSDGTFMDYFKALEKGGRPREVLKDMITQIWESGERETVIEVGEVPDLPEWGSLGAWQKVQLARQHGLRIAFLKENPKKADSKSEARYEEYRAAETVEEALRRGAIDGKQGDLVFDQEAGFLRILPEEHRRKVTVKPAEATPEQFPEQWRTSKCIILWKGKGCKKQLDNFRGIMLLEAAASIMMGVMNTRLQQILECEGREEQCGYRRWRGGRDADFSLRTGLKRRQEHGLNSYVIFSDIEKGFDSVPREIIWGTLEKMGVPGHFLQVLKRYYTNREVAIVTDGGEVKVGSTSGVMQGCRLSPTLFLFIMEALTELIEPRWKGKPIFHANYQATGARRLQVCSANPRNKGSTKDGFALWTMEQGCKEQGWKSTTMQTCWSG